MHVARTCIIIFIIAFSVFNQSISQKKLLKIVENEIYSKIFEIYKRTEKVELVKFVEVIPFSGSHFF